MDCGNEHSSPSSFRFINPGPKLSIPLQKKCDWTLMTWRNPGSIRGLCGTAKGRRLTDAAEDEIRPSAQPKKVHPRPSNCPTPDRAQSMRQVFRGPRWKRFPERAWQKRVRARRRCRLDNGPPNSPASFSPHDRETLHQRSSLRNKNRVQRPAKNTQLATEARRFVLFGPPLAALIARMLPRNWESKPPLLGNRKSIHFAALTAHMTGLKLLAKTSRNARN